MCRRDGGEDVDEDDRSSGAASIWERRRGLDLGSGRGSPVDHRGRAAVEELNVETAAGT
jgi:hypothetical protein